LCEFATHAGKIRSIETATNLAMTDLTANDERAPAAIGDRLKLARLALDLSQRELCDRVGIGFSTYNQWEKGRKRPEIDEANKLCDRLGYSLDWIYRGDMSNLRRALAQRIDAFLASRRRKP
jgi:transcriptional regulator with XRE-family HTH domain